MEQKFAELQFTLDRMGNRIEDNIKRLTKAESRISEGEDHTTSLENQVTELEQKVKLLTDWTEDIENMSHRENIRVIGLKVCTEGRQAIKFLKPGSQTCLD